MLGLPAYSPGKEKSDMHIGEDNLHTDKELRAITGVIIEHECIVSKPRRRVVSMEIN